MSNRHPIVVVGGGTAGCAVVAQLASSTTEEIVLIERGELSLSDDDSRFMNLLSSPLVDESSLVSLVDGGELEPYIQARSLGGSSAINGMLLTGEAPESLAGLTRMASEADLGPLSQALLACGGRPSRLWWNGGRWNPGRAVQHLVDEGRVRHVRESATSLVYGKGGVSAVVTENSTVDAHSVVMCAGALTTPALLLPMKLGKLNRDVGLGLQNHPTISFVVRLRKQVSPLFDVTVVAEKTTSSGARLMAIAYERVSDTDDSHGLLTVSLMNPTSRGAVWTSEEGVMYDFNMLANESDRTAMREGLHWLLELTSQPSFVSVMDGVFVDDGGSSALLLDGMKNAELDVWIRDNLTLVSHAAASCSQAIDDRGKLVGLSNVYIADASALPGVPSETPAASVTMEATRIARLLAEELK